ncbi:hypothetical protein, partial [Streptomyces otsuchiensis]|uniref:hypothetical protein n=1 Tax=Streptomyces otsuchiensis TaxID=2681388 RepID=UPI001300B9BF
PEPDPAPELDADADPEPAIRSQAAYFAERLAENPLHISDSVPRDAPRSAAPLFEEQMERTGVPTFLLILPGGSVTANAETLLATVHERHGEDGLYVAMVGSRLEAAAFGSGVPARHAAFATQGEVPRDAGRLRTFTHFVDVLLSGEAEERATAARERGYDDRPDDMFISRTDRRNQAFVTGLALTGVPLLLIGVVWSTRHLTGRGPRPLRDATPAAVVLAVVIGLGAPVVFDQTVTSDAPLPTEQDLTARSERVAAGLREQPLFLDPELPPLLTTAEERELAERIEELPMPLYVVAVPNDFASESYYRSEYLAALLQQELGDDALYAIMDQRGRDIRLAEYGPRIGRDVQQAVRDVRDADLDAGAPELLDALLTALETTEPDTSLPPRAPSLDDAPLSQEERVRLDSLYAGDFFPGLLVGAFAGPTAAGAVHGVLFGVASWRAPQRVARRELLKQAGSGPGRALAAQHRPRLRWLRRATHGELVRLAAAYEEKSEGVSEPARRRAFQSLDAATLLLDADGDGRVDPDTPQQDLVLALVLLRAGGAALERGARRQADRMCSVNPLHGVATARRRLVFLPSEPLRDRSLCGACDVRFRGTERRRIQNVSRRTLELRREPGGDPAPDGRPPVRPYPGSPFGSARWQPYHRLTGPLGSGGAAGLSIERMIRQAREARGVH